MVTSLYTADVKLNKTDKDYTKRLLVVNEEALRTSDVELKNKRHIGDITL